MAATSFDGPPLATVAQLPHTVLTNGMTKLGRPLRDDIKHCLDEWGRAHIPIVEWIKEGMRWLNQGHVSRRGLIKAERNCARYLAALQENKDVLRVMEAKCPGFNSLFAEGRAGVDMVTLRIQAFLRRIRTHEHVVPDQPFFVVNASLDALPAVMEAYTALVMEQERDFGFFAISPDFMDAALLHAELDSIEDGCDEQEGFAAALEERVLQWRPNATPEQQRLLTQCESLTQRLRFVQASKRQAVTKLRDATVDRAVAVKLKKLMDEARPHKRRRCGKQAALIWPPNLPSRRSP